MAKVALLIGVSEYEVGLNPLPAAVKDVVALERILKDSEMGDFDEVKILTNPEPQAMQYEVETLFSGRSKDDFVLLFFSGHGIKDDSNNLYFATRITKKSEKGDLIRSTAVPARFVHEVMNNSRAKRQAIILDCCFSGAFDPSLFSKDDGSVDLQGQLGAEGRVVLTSSSSTQYSFEQQGSDLSLYTRYLIEGIETGAGDRNEDGKISVRELHEYATSKVQETAPSMTPKLITLKDLGFDLVLAKAKVTDPKLRYRKAASRYANVGKIRPAGRAVLNTLRQQLGLSIEETNEIENELLHPYQERLANLQQYRETLLAEAEYEYPLSETAYEDLNILQQMFGLRDEDILPIQQEIEARFSQAPIFQQESFKNKEKSNEDLDKKRQHKEESESKQNELVEQQSKRKKTSSLTTSTDEYTRAEWWEQYEIPDDYEIFDYSDQKINKCHIIVSNLSPEVTKDHLLPVFEDYGTVKNVSIEKDIRNTNYVCGFVEMSSEAEAINATNALDEAEWMGRIMRVKLGDSSSTNTDDKYTGSEWWEQYEIPDHYESI